MNELLNALIYFLDIQIQDLNSNLIYNFQVTVACGWLSEVFYLHFHF